MTSIAQTTDKCINNFRAVFTDKQLSTNVTATYVQNFKDTIGLCLPLEQHLQQYDSLKIPNSIYSIAGVLDFMDKYSLPWLFPFSPYGGSADRLGVYIHPWRI